MKLHNKQNSSENILVSFGTTKVLRKKIERKNGKKKKIWRIRGLSRRQSSKERIRIRKIKAKKF